MGPDGVGGGRSGVKVSEVDATGSSIKVTITPPDGFFHDFLRVTASWTSREHVYDIEIRGGNTNNGDGERYERAARAYRDAVEIYEWMFRMADKHDDWFQGYEDEQLPAVVAGQPDYMCALFLCLSGDNDFMYQRGYEPEEGHRNPSVIGLAALRERVLAAIRSKVTA